MDESIVDRIPRLERSVRFWRGTSLILAAILVSVLVMSVLVMGFGLGNAHLRAMRATDAAIMRQKVQAEVAAQAALIQAQALEEAKKKQRE
jgi:Tfp pilus assembly protein PilV